MTKIIAFTGKLQSGKSSTANQLAGNCLVDNGIIDKYEVGESGELLVPTVVDGQITMNVLDLSRQDDVFKAFAEKLVWPYVKLYSFADPLKEICMNLLGLTFEQCFGSNDEKNSLTSVLWENLPHYIRIKNAKKENCPKGPMTAREVMQHIGTEVFRKMSQDCWVNHCIHRIEKDKPKVAMICDCRFPNEVKAVKNAGGKVIRLLRSVNDDKHESETVLDAPKYDQSNFDMIIDNKNLSIVDTYNQLRVKLIEWGMLS